MVLTPKNWAEFQHYKDRKPAWIKLHRALLDDYEFSCLPVASRALAPCLWLLASEYEGGEITASTEELAFRLRMTVKELQQALTPLIHKGFFVASAPLADCKRGAIPEKERETQVKTEKESCAVEFEKWKSAYPKRKGAQGWPEAQKHFERAIKDHPPDVLIGATKKYAETIPTDRNGSEFIPMASTFMSKKLYLEFIPTPEDIEKARKTEEFLASRGFGVIEGGRVDSG